MTFEFTEYSRYTDQLYTDYSRYTDQFGLHASRYIYILFIWHQTIAGLDRPTFFIFFFKCCNSCMNLIVDLTYSTTTKLDILSGGI